MQNTQIKRDFAGTSVIQVNIKTTVYLSIPLSPITPCEPMGGCWSGPKSGILDALVWVFIGLTHLPILRKSLMRCSLTKQMLDPDTAGLEYLLRWHFFQQSTVETFWYFTLYRLWVLWKKCYQQCCGMITPGEEMRFFVWWSLLATDPVGVWLSSLPNWSFLKGLLCTADIPVLLQHPAQCLKCSGRISRKGSVYFMVGGEWSFGAKHSCIQSSCSAS